MAEKKEFKLTGPGEESSWWSAMLVAMSTDTPEGAAMKADVAIIEKRKRADAPSGGEL